ncbi:MAG: AAA family ATPase, partial [Chloroflexota bacterium]|nr:AAA family ATPase [Chloroflexota bacterium]
LKGKALSVAAWRATRVRAGRGGRRATLGLEAPMVGRDEELTLLKETVRRTASEKRPHLVTVLGSAGVGKSRLTWELEKYLDGLPDRFHWRKGRCLAYAQTSYSALADAVAADASVLEDDPTDAVEAKITARLADLAGGEPPADVAAAIRALLALSTAENLSKAELFEAWRVYLELIARRYPLVLVLEDIHWADEGLLDFIEFLARWADAPIMILCLARHELLERRPAWAGGLPNAASIVLEPLSADESGRLLSGLLGSAMPAELERRVIEVSEGNPLFAEELVRLFVDRGVVRHTESGWEQAQPIAEVEIPQSIQALLAARLDSLPAEEKRISQDAAVVGRIFWDRLLAHLAGQSPTATVGLLRSLRVKELVVPREPSTLTDAQEYAFRHVLIRDVAYDSLPKLERARKHREVAAWAEDRLGDRADEVVELLAAHYWSALRYEEEFATDDAALADLRRRTMEYASAAGRRAYDVSQYASAAEWSRIAVEQARKLRLEPTEFAEVVVAYLRYTDQSEAYDARLLAAREAIAGLLDKDELTEEERRLVANLRTDEAYIAFASTSTSADEIRGWLGSALELLDGIGPCPERAAVNRVLGWLAWRSGPFADAEPHLRAAIDEARAIGNARHERWAMHDLGIVLTRARPEPEGLALLQRSLELALAGKDVALVSRCYINIPATLSAFNRTDEAMQMAAEGFDVALRTGDRNAQYWIGTNLADFHHTRGNLRDAIRIQEQALDAARSLGFQRSTGIPQYTHMLLNGGRFDDARASWQTLVTDDRETEPQNLGRNIILEALFRWADDPDDAVQFLRSHLTTTGETAGWRNALIVVMHLARMALRTGFIEGIREAADAARKAAEAAPDDRFVTALDRWVHALIHPDQAASATEVAAVAASLEADGWLMLASGAYGDATLIADQLRLPEGHEWAARARSLHEQMSSVPVLEAIRSSVR